MEGADLDLEALGEAATELPNTGPPDPNIELHVDGDYAAYYFSGNDDTSLGEARRNAMNAFRTAAAITRAGGRKIIHITAGLSDKGGRFKIATVKPYQGQRDSSRRPKNWEGLRLWLEEGKLPEGWTVKTWDDREADDGVALCARYALSVGRVPAMFYRDKDFRMIPGLHLSWTTYSQWRLEPTDWKVDTGEEDSNGPIILGQWYFWYQLLAGDSADNIPGLEKQPAAREGTFKACGGKGAIALLEGCKTPEEAYKQVRELYKAYYGGSWADRLVEQMALLWLRTDNAADPTDFLRAVPANDRELEVAAKKLKARIE